MIAATHHHRPDETAPPRTAKVASPPVPSPPILPAAVRVRGLSAGQTLALATLFLVHAAAELAAVSSPLLSQTLLFARLSLCAAWIAFGPLPWFVRGPLGALAIVAMTWWAMSSGHAEIVLALTAIQVGFILAVGMVAAFCRVRMRHYPPGTAPQTPEMQFSIGQLLVVTIVAALAFAGSRSLRPWLAEFATVPVWLGTASLAVAFATVALLAVWAVLPTGATWRRWMLLAGVAPLVGAVLPYLFHRVDDWPLFAAWTAAQGLVLVISLALVRGCGFRLIRQARLGNSAAAGDV